MSLAKYGLFPCLITYIYGWIRLVARGDNNHGVEFLKEKDMVTSATSKAKNTAVNKTEQDFGSSTGEVIAFCPKCKTIETLWLTGNGQIQTRKFKQVGALVYHDCGSSEPCHLLPRFMKRR